MHYEQFSYHTFSYYAFLLQVIHSCNSLPYRTLSQPVDVAGDEADPDDASLPGGESNDPPSLPRVVQEGSGGPKISWLDGADFMASCFPFLSRLTDRRRWRQMTLNAGTFPPGLKFTIHVQTLYKHVQFTSAYKLFTYCTYLESRYKATWDRGFKIP